GAAFKGLERVTVYLARVVCAHLLEHGRKGGLFAAHVPCEHRPARNEYRWYVHSGRGHQHAGYNFVAVADEYCRLESVRADKYLRAVGNYFAGGEGVPHARVSHGDAVAHAYGWHYHRFSARGYNALGSRAGNFV